MQNPASPEHAWFKKFVGDWSFTATCPPSGDGEGAESKGRDRVRMLGDLWMVCEAEGPMPGGGICYSVMTIGYDPRIERFIGSWVGSPMSTMFTYEGELSEDGSTLTLNTTGPDMTDPSKTAKYRDVIVWIDDNSRELRSQCVGEDGEWTEMMRAKYTREG